jgi:hypothetical protein
MIGKQINERTVDEYEEECNIINQITNKLPRYYKMNIYLGIDKEEDLPTITVQVDEYINQYDNE